MDFRLSEEQELIVDSYRAYMESENWEAYFHECDERHEYPLRWVAGLCELGFDQIMLPESHGGLGLEQPCVTLMAVYEVLGRYGAPTYVLYQLPGFETVIREGTPAQIEAVMSTLGTGEQIWNSACTEPGAGSDVGALATTYRRENGKVYLNGTKTFITSSAGVRYLVVMAKSAEDDTVFSEFFVDMEKPGITLSPLPKLGLRMDSCCEVYFDNVELDEADFFGTEGNGFNRGVSDFNFERWLVGACDYGTAISAFEDAVAHANARTAFGRPIGRFQLNQLKIAEMQIALTNMRNMLYEAAWKADQADGTFDPTAAAMCKYYCANAAFQVTDDAMQVMGGIAVASEHRINRIWRDLRVDRISGGTDEMMILTASKGVSRGYRS
ncbi:crotonobetainyl-CoA dehydrogenase [Eggerthellaceae bacterium zg-1084]|uniref:crotonobetainyl-CoA dehydrogenase n=1 Tax=Berryella wangjianweii TaxID=2734634 RepID=UPI001551F7C1|nr:crotonobetainyl-CoA dehydrogenase [Berryella wangjianweii]NPD30365.1 crotonobetainyl-CoA dehydrogenase [Berryella wangjianweii]NPD32668.1 crotonobetainyl-CoA dehydrogenase [Eggerthellaceae bacterium zg-997]